jgi:hypothetical protein
MTVTNWTVSTINGKQFLTIDVAAFRIPLDWDPSSNMFIAVAAPDGALGNFPFAIKGDDGLPASFVAGTFTALAATDPTPDSFAVVPAGLNSAGGPAYAINVALHKGADGASGTSVLVPSAYGTPVSKRMLIVNPTADGFIYQPQLIGDRYIPAAIVGVPSGNPLYTLCPVPVPAQLFDWRPEVSGYCAITGTGPNVSVDLIARLNATDTSAPEVGRATGAVGVGPTTLVLSSGPPAGSADAYDRIAAGATATIYLRTERQSGSDTYTTAAATTRFKVRVMPIL